MSDDAWLEGGDVAPAGGPLTVPIYNARKSDVGLATGYSPAKIDRLIRLGMPCRRGASNRDGYRFDLPALIEWLAAHRAAEQGGGDDTTLAAAKRRKALADARRWELETQRREGELIEVESVVAWIKNSYAGVRSRLVNLESEIPGLSDKQSDTLRDAVHDMLTEISAEAFERNSDLGSESQNQKGDANLNSQQW